MSGRRKEPARARKPVAPLAKVYHLRVDTPWTRAITAYGELRALAGRADLASLTPAEARAVRARMLDLVDITERGELDDTRRNTVIWWWSKVSRACSEAESFERVVDLASHRLRRAAGAR